MQIIDRERYPRAWYPLCLSTELRDRPLAIEAFGARWVAYRGLDGRPALLHSVCPHLGADLTRGDVIDGRLRCHFHHWAFGRDGRCEDIPVCATPPKNVRLAALVCEERYGIVFGFLGGPPRFELPSPELAPTQVSRPTSFIAEVPYQMVGVNIFDSQHLLSVHDRALIGEPTVSIEHDALITIRYRAKVVGERAYDRLLRRLGFDEVSIAIDDWGGSCFLCHFPKQNHVTLLAALPITADRARIFCVTLANRPDTTSPLRRLRGRLLAEVHNALNVWFIRPDVASVTGCNLEIKHLLPDADRVLAQWLAHYRKMPTENLSQLLDAR